MIDPFPDALDTCYTNWAPLTGGSAGIEQTGGVVQDNPNLSPRRYEGRYLGGALGTYMSNANGAMMATVLSSLAMGDEAFWNAVPGGEAVVPFAKRVRYDPQMWEGAGVSFDALAPGSFYTDIKGHGGTGSGWMTAMWDLVSPVDAGGPAEFSTINFGTSGIGLEKATSPLPNGTQYTMVCRFRVEDTPTFRNFFYDTAAWIGATIRTSNFISTEMWGPASAVLSNTGTGLTEFLRADGMVTVFISGHSDGTPTLQMYKNDTVVTLTGVTAKRALCSSASRTGGC